MKFYLETELEEKEEDEIIEDEDEKDESLDDIENEEEEESSESDTDEEEEDDDEDEYDDEVGYDADPVEDEPIDDEDSEDEYEFGSDDSDINNDYDEKEANILNQLISSEASAVKEYLDAGMETVDDYRKRLFMDIANEERFHFEQLMYAKAKLTGEKYEPSDPEVKREYEELCESGMDEDSAMATACDKCAISHDNQYTTDSIDEIIDDIDDFTESFVESATNNLTLASFDPNKVQDVYMEYADALYMEAIDNVSDRTTKRDDSVHPIRFIISTFSGILKFIRRMVIRIKDFLRKVHKKDMNKINFIKKHGIKDLFKDGIWLYLWSNEGNHLGGFTDGYRYLDLFDRVMKTIQSSMYNKKEANPKSFKPLMNMKNPLQFRNIDDGVRMLRNVVFSKEKIIITDSNEIELEKIFFGVNDNESGAPSQNLYNLLEYLANEFERMSKDCENLLDSLRDLEGNYDSVYSKNPSLYNKLISATKSLSKDFTKFSKVIAHDITTIMKMNTGLYELMKEYDSNKMYNRGLNDEAKEDIKNGKFERKEAPEGLKDYYPPNDGESETRPSRF